MAGIKNIWGGASAMKTPFETPEELAIAFKVLKEGGVDTIDTATLYGPSQSNLSKAGAQKQFKIDTKAIGGFKEKGASKENILQNGLESLELFGKVDTYFIHGPDSNTPLEESLEGINELYKKGLFKRFGISNYKAEEVQKVYDIAKAKGYPLPVVYQGNYNAFARGLETILFPTLKKLNIAFYAYSPIAGGFLAKSKDEIMNGKGRFDPNHAFSKLYTALYKKPALLDALAEWGQIAEDEGITRAELAYRWVKYNSPLKPEHGDAIIVGASSVEQLKQTLAGLNKGPLSDSAAKRIDAVWKVVEHEAPLNNFGN